MGFIARDLLICSAETRQPLTLSWQCLRAPRCKMNHGSVRCHDMTEPLSFGWGATLVLLAVVLIAVAAFWLWWMRPNRGRRTTDSPSEVDVQESKERLDLLRAAKQWGDVSSTDPMYLRRKGN